LTKIVEVFALALIPWALLGQKKARFILCIIYFSFSRCTVQGGNESTAHCQWCIQSTVFKAKLRGLQFSYQRLVDW